LQTQQAGFAQPAQQKAQQNDPLAALSKALAALEQAVQALSSKGFNNGQSVAQQATQNLGQSGKSQQPAFDFSNLFSGGSVFDQQKSQPAQQTYQPSQPTYQPSYQAPVQQQTAPAQTNNSFLNGSGGGAGPVHGNSDHHIQQFGNDRSGGGGRVDPGGANNRVGG
ncbi:MAG TPA: hypothetical protein VIG99_07490, partial [Myxococcaceae bacterium]|jgi:hypothetical protein